LVRISAASALQSLLKDKDMMTERFLVQFALFAVLAAFLSACGVDGEPTAPAAKPATASGVSITGEGRVGFSN
jgi:hypothetical protein